MTSQFPVWQPIESAPKDKLIFAGELIDMPPSRTSRYIATYSPNEKRWTAIGFYAEPTHWMSLPEPPE